MVEEDTFEYFSPRKPRRKSTGTHTQLLSDLHGHLESRHLTASHQGSLQHLQDPEHTDRIDCWLYGAIPHMLASVACARAIERGELPPQVPTMPGLHLSSFEFIDFDYDLGNLDVSVMRALGLSELIYDLIRTSKKRECPLCGSVVRLYKDPHDVAEHIREAVQKGAITLLASGGLSTKEWATSEGFTSLPRERLSNLNFPHHHLPDDHSVFLLDTSERHSSTWMSFIRFLPNLLRITGTSLYVSSLGALSSFSRYGTCSTCLQSGVHLPTQLPSDHVMTTSNFDGRYVGSCSYSNFISSEITPELVEYIPHSRCKTALLSITRFLGLTRFSGASLKLNAKVHEFNKSQILLARKMIQLMLYQETEPLVLHAPYSWLSLSESVHFKNVIEERARDVPILILRGTEKIESTMCGYRSVQVIEPKSLTKNLDLKSIEVIPAPKSEDLLLSEWLDIAPLLFRRFASSVVAKMEGVSEKDYKRLRSRKPNHDSCPECKGTGLLAVPSASGVKGTSMAALFKCTHCDGTRYTAKVGKIQVKGLTISEYLDQTFKEADHFLRTLPTLATTLDTLNDLALDYLPLGLPTHLLSPSERLLLGYVKTLKTLPQPDPRVLSKTEFKITAHLPAATLSTVQRANLARVIRLRTPPNVFWSIETDAPEFK